MAKHTGEPCFFCHKPLEENDDVVVCPDCGTPYHRACWKENHCCINQALHISGESWQPEEKVKPSPDCICGNCGTENAPGSAYCTHCGVPMASPVHPTENNPQPEGEPQKEGFWDRIEQSAAEAGIHDMPEELDKQENLGDITLEEAAEFVGTNRLYYLPKFLRFHKTGRQISCNIPCLFFPGLYFANRKMWLLAGILTLISALLNLPQMAATLQSSLPDMITAFEDTGASQMAALYPNMTEMLTAMQEKLELWEVGISRAVLICSYLKIAMGFVLAILGNWIYYRFVQRRVLHIKSMKLGITAEKTKLRMEGGTNFWLMLAMVGIYYVTLLVLTTILMVVLLF